MSPAARTTRVLRTAPPQAPIPTADLEMLARWMDSVFVVPGTNIRFGLDSLLGLIPGLGDAATSLVSLYLMSAASRHGVSRVTMARMGMNIAIDLVVGAVPLAGDLFDVYWKANQKNVELLRRHVTAAPHEAKRLQWGDRAFVAAMVVALVLLLIGAAVVAWWIVAAIVSGLSRVAS